MKRLLGFIGVLGVLLAIAFFQAPQSAQSSQTKLASKHVAEKPRIGILQTQSHPALDEIHRGVVAQLRQRGFKDGKTVTIDFENAQGDQSNLQTMAQRFQTKKTALNIGIATPAAQALANTNTQAPLILGAISDPKAAGLVHDNRQPGTNVTGVSSRTPVKQQLQLIRQVLPDIKKLGVIYTSSDPSAQAEVAVLRHLAPQFGFKLHHFTVANSNDVDQVAQLAVQQVQAIYVPSDNTIASALQTLLNHTNQAKVPVFPATAKQVQAGGLASYGLDQYALGVATGNMAADVLQGKTQPAKTPIKTVAKGKLAINQKAAVALGIKLPAAVTKQAQQKGVVYP